MTSDLIKNAKLVALKATSRYLSAEETIARLEDYRRYAANADTENIKELWAKEIKSLEEWLESEALKSGTHPQGIDDLIINLIEWRASVYAFQNVEIKSAPFAKSQFFAQWITGAAYSTACIIGKLASRNKQDNSLTNIWEQVVEAIVEAGNCTKDEASAISSSLHRREGKFNNASSSSILLRNKVIAHNERSLQIEWAALDEDIKILVRAWAIIVAFCSFGIIEPFCGDDIAFNLIGCIEQSELSELKKYRREFIDKAIKWSKTGLTTGSISELPGAFASISVTVRLPS